MKLIVIPEVRTNPQTRTLETRWNAFWVRSRFLLLLRWDFLPSIAPTPAKTFSSEADLNAWVDEQRKRAKG